MWEGSWKRGSGLCQAPGQKEMHAGKLVSLEGEKGHAESPRLGSCQGKSIKTRVSERQGFSVQYSRAPPHR